MYICMYTYLLIIVTCIFMYIYLYMYIYIHETAINEENDMNLSESKDICTDVWESLRWEKEKLKWYNSVIISKIKERVSNNSIGEKNP